MSIQHNQPTESADTTMRDLILMFGGLLVVAVIALWFYAG